MSTQIAPLLLVLTFFWLTARALDHFPGARTSKRLIKGFFNTTLVKPSRRRGAFFGLWFFLLTMAIISTLGVVLFPSDEGIKGVLALWAAVIAGSLLLTRSSRLSDSRRRYPLPTRHRRR